MIAIILDTPENKLNLYGNLIGNLYTYFVPHIEIHKARKILIHFVSEKNCCQIFPEDGEKIYTIKKTFDFRSFENSDSDEKCESLTNDVFDCLKIFFDEFKINTDVLDVAYKQIKESNYILKRIICGGAKENKEKKVIATVFAKHFLEYASLSVEFIFKNGDIVKEIPICKSDPAYFIYSNLFSSAKWDDNNKFRISNKTKEINLIVNINEGVSILYNSIDKDVDDLKEELKFLTREFCFPV